ncbi:MAG: Putative choline transporter, neither null mutation nor overexpression affects choline transport [Tremellales sp. Tagirdzhanova-0007]|nr:MAG: Putative choline transporter, neither null mutation nor overexpression affects choline transport [Tremellales sp. Tagirdzhanova-0007]
MAEKNNAATQADASKPSWAGVHDRKSLYFFIPFMIAYFGLGFYSLYEIKENWTAETDFKSPDLGNLKISSRDASSGPGLNAHTALMFVATTALATTFSGLLLLLIRFKAIILLYLSPAFSVIICIGMAIGNPGLVTAYLHLWLYLVMVAVCLAIFIWIIILLRSRMELAKLCLQCTSHVAGRHGTVYVTAILGVLVHVSLSITNSLFVIATFLKYEPEHQGKFFHLSKAALDPTSGCPSASCSWQLVFIFVSFELFCHVWLSGVVTNIVTCTVAGGPFSRWYFSPQDEVFRTTRRAFKLAVKRSIGSVVLGSALVAIIETLHFIAKLLAGDHNDSCCACISYCCIALLKFMDLLIKKFNKYVYIMIAVGPSGADQTQFSQDYVGLVVRFKSPSDPANRVQKHGAIATVKFVIRGKKLDKKDIERDVKSIVYRQGITAIVNDCFVGAALHMGCVASAILCAAFTYVYMYVIDGKAVINDWLEIPLVLYAFVLTLNICLVLTSVLEAGVTTLFVCISKSPDQLQAKAPKIHAFILENKNYKDALFLPGDSQSSR